MADYKTDIDSNLWGFYREIARLAGYNHGSAGNIEYIWNRRGTWPAYLMGKPRVEELPEIINGIIGKQLPGLWIMDHEGDQEIISMLEESNIRVIREWKGMVLEREMYIVPELQQNADITVNEREALISWLELVNRDLMTGSQIDLLAAESFPKSGKFTWFVGYLEKLPATSGLIFMSEGIAGLYMIATREKYRGKGLGMQMTSAMVEHSFDAGAERIVLHATPAGEGLYRKLGFKEINTLSIFWHLQD